MAREEKSPSLANISPSLKKPKKIKASVEDILDAIIEEIIHPVLLKIKKKKLKKTQEKIEKKAQKAKKEAVKFLEKKDKPSKKTKGDPLPAEQILSSAVNKTPQTTDTQVSLTPTARRTRSRTPVANAVVAVETSATVDPTLPGTEKPPRSPRRSGPSERTTNPSPKKRVIKKVATPPPIKPME